MRASLASVLVWFGAAQAASASNLVHGAGGANGGGGHATNGIHIRFDAGIEPTEQNGVITTGVEEIDALIVVWKVSAATPYLVGTPRYPQLAGQLGLDRSWMLFVPLGTDTPAMVAAFEAVAGVEFAELDGIGGVAAIPDDPDFDQQYHLNNTGQEGGVEDADIDAPEAWEIFSGLNPSRTITIAIIDTGIDTQHEDLAANLVPGWNTHNNTNDTEDRFGHGTHCAGIAGAIGDNNLGVAGVSWNLKIMPIKCLNDQGSGTESQCAKAVAYAADHGCQVASMSLRYSQGSQGFRDAIDYAWGAGLLLVAAAGNSGTRDIRYPAKFENCMAITATDRNDNFAGFSSWGSETDVCAPGVDVYSTQRVNRYELLSGTSMSTPCVAGLGALLMQFNPGMINAEALQILTTTADDLGPGGYDEKFGWGRINAYRAISAAEPCTALCGDSNCDGVIDFTDVDCFAAALQSRELWSQCGNDCRDSERAYLCVNDINGDQDVTFEDIDVFVTSLIGGGCN